MNIQFRPEQWTVNSAELAIHELQLKLDKLECESRINQIRPTDDDVTIRAKVTILFDILTSQVTVDHNICTLRDIIRALNEEAITPTPKECEELYRLEGCYGSLAF